MSPAQSSPVLSCSVQETSTCSWVSPLHLETGFCGNFCSPSCITAILTLVPHCFTTELGCVCCPGAACKAPGAPVPSAQPLSAHRTGSTARIKPCSTANRMAAIPKYHLWGNLQHSPHFIVIVTNTGCAQVPKSICVGGFRN